MLRASLFFPREDPGRMLHLPCLVFIQTPIHGAKHNDVPALFTRMSKCPNFFSTVSKAREIDSSSSMSICMGSIMADDVLASSDFTALIAASAFSRERLPRSKL